MFVFDFAKFESKTTCVVPGEFELRELDLKACAMCSLTRGQGLKGFQKMD